MRLRHVRRSEYIPRELQQAGNPANTNIGVHIDRRNWMENTMRPMVKWVAAIFATIVLSMSLVAGAQDEPKQVLFTNVNVFDGFSSKTT
jgi:hypothetical protein